jgi:serine/threonine-protein kinase CHEK2
LAYFWTPLFSEYASQEGGIKSEAWPGMESCDHPLSTFYADDLKPPATVEEESETGKRRRRSERLSRKAQDSGTPLKPTALPSPYTHTSSLSKDGTVTPPSSSANKNKHQLLSPASPEQSLSQFYGDSQTQPFSQVIYPPPTISYEVDDEETDDVWGYMVPVDSASDKYGILVLKERQTCAKDDPNLVGDSSVSKSKKQQENDKGNSGSKKESVHSRGYLVGRHPECGELQLL